MRFSLKTLQIAVLAFILTLGLPALLPSSMLQGLIWLAEALLTIAFLTRLIYTRGPSQAFALGVTGMGLLLLVGGKNGSSGLELFSSLGSGYIWYRTLPMVGGMSHVVLMFGAGYFARWIYDQLPRDGQP